MESIRNLWSFLTPLEQMGNSFQELQLLFDPSRDHLLLQGPAVLSLLLPAKTLRSWLAPNQIWADVSDLESRGLEKESLMAVNYRNTNEIFTLIEKSARFWQMG